MPFWKLYTGFPDSSIKARTKFSKTLGGRKIWLVPLSRIVKLSYGIDKDSAESSPNFTPCHTVDQKKS
jgi:hypothetical protein